MNPHADSSDVLHHELGGVAEQPRRGGSNRRVDSHAARAERARPAPVLSGECVEFSGGKFDTGYGAKYRPSDRKMVKAHRFFWEQEHGPIAEGMELHHRCRNRSCIRFDHLELLSDFEHRRLHGMYTRDDIVAAMWGFEAKYGRQPVACDWSPTKALEQGQHEKARRYFADGWPHYSTAVLRFGSWGAALKAAGFTPDSRGLRTPVEQDDCLHCGNVPVGHVCDWPLRWPS